MTSSTRIEDIRYVPYPKCSHYANVGWLPRLNVRREYGTVREMRIARDMLSTALGWDAQYPAIVEVATADEIDELLKKMESDWNVLKSAVDSKDLESVPIDIDGTNVSIDGREYLLAKLACFEFLYVDKKGRLIPPTCIGTTGNRRGSVLLDAVTCQLIRARRAANDNKLQPADVKDQLTTHIFVLVPDTDSKRFPDVAVRKQAQLRENETKTEGFKRMTDAERLEACLDLVENHGKSQSDIRNAGYGAVLGLRLYFACVIDVYIRQRANDHSLSREERKRWSEIKLMERLMSPQFLSDADREAGKVNPNWLEFAKFQQRSFQGDKDNVSMGLMCETDTKFEKENRRRASLKTPQSPLMRPTPASMLEWINKQAFEGGARVKPQLKRETVSNLAERDPNPFVKDAMKAVDQNDEAFLARAHARGKVCQFVYSVDDTTYALLESACLGLFDLDEDTQRTLLAAFSDEIEKAVATATEAEAEAPASETTDAEVES